MRGQGAADQVQVGRVGVEHRGAFFAGFKILRTRFDGGQLGVRAGGGGLGFDHAQVVEVPSHGARSAHLPFAKQHPHLGRRALDVVGQAFDHHRHLVRRMAFIHHMLKIHDLTGQARAFFDGALQRFFGHRHFARLLQHQPQLGVERRVSAIARRDHDLFGQLAKHLPPGISGQFFALGFPLRAHDVIP